MRRAGGANASTRPWAFPGYVVLALIGLLLTLACLPAALAAPMGASAPASALGSPRTFTSGPCSGSGIPGSFTGTLGVERDGGPGPSVANVTISTSYFYTWNYSPKGGPSSLRCVESTTVGTSDGAGAVAIAAPVPATSCDSASCSTYAGPYGPLRFGDPGGNPPGYFLTSHRSGTSVTLDFVLALASLQLSPYGRTVVSVLAPTPITAWPESGNGGASPANLSFAWRLAGSGWAVDSGLGSATVTIAASVGAGGGQVELWTNGTYNGTPVSAGPVTLALSAVATSISSQSVAPTSLDAGESVTFSVSGTGAAGYDYTGEFHPGLGMPSTNASCSTSIVPGGIVDLTCSTKFVYSASGDAQPSVSLTNSYSTASTALAAVSVAPSLGVAVAPSSIQTYVAAPTRLTVSASAGSGTPPYGPACLSTGDGRTYCSNSTQGPWPFDVAWGSSGTYGALASVLDTAGVNRTVGVAVQVVTRPTLDSIAPTSSTVRVGDNVTLSSYARGGAYPVSYWWNDSAPNGTIYAGAVDRDAPLEVRYSPSIAGVHDITLTSVDQLGTRSSQQIEIAASYGDPVALRFAGGPPNSTVAAGSPWLVSLQSVDPWGHRVTGVPGNETLVVSVGVAPVGGTTWVNDSAGAIALNSTPDASEFRLVLPATAFDAGVLNLSIAPTRTGVVALAFLGPLTGPSAPAGGLVVRVTPDPVHLRLSDPRVVVAGDRHNATVYRVTDRFGNAAPGVGLVIREVFGSTVVVTNPRTFGNATESWVWVNFTAPSSGSGTVYVENSLGTLELIAIPVPAAAPASLTPWIAAGVVLGLVGVAVAGYGYRRHRRLAGLSSRSGDAGEDDLRRLAEGRAHILSKARTDHPSTVAELGAGFPPPLPTGAEVAEWVGSLVSEGALRAVVGPDGRPGFVRVPDPPVPARLRVDVDPMALDEALAGRDDPEERTPARP